MILNIYFLMDIIIVWSENEEELIDKEEFEDVPPITPLEETD